MASAPLTKLLPKTLCLFNVISLILDTVGVDENRMHYIVIIDGNTLAPYNALSNNGTDQDSDTQRARNRRNNDEKDENNAFIIGEFAMQHIVKHLGTGKRMKCIVRFYDYGPDADAVEPPQHIP